MAGSRKRRMRGGDLSSWFSGATSSLTDAWNKTKSAASGAYSSATGSSTDTTSTYTPTSTDTTSTYTPMGGRRRRTKRMRGGSFTDNMPTTGLAAHASPISGISSVRAQMVGGRTRRHRRHRRSKSRRRR